MTSKQRKELEDMASNTRLRPSLRRRAWMVLAVLEGMDINDVASKVRMTPERVEYWVKRYETDGVETLRHNRISEQRAKVAQFKRETIIHYTLNAKPFEGRYWTGPALAELVGVTPQYVYKVWNEEGINPRSRRT